MARAAALWGVFLFLGPAWAPAAGASHAGDLGCGNLAPFVNECVDSASVLYGGHESVELAYFGFAGRLELTLEQRVPWLGLTLRKTWSCDVVLVQAPWPVAPQCTGPTMSPVWLPHLIQGWPVTLRCRAWPMGVASTLALGPVGPWGCSASL